MVEQDYIMRLIKEMVRALLKLIFYSHLNEKSNDFLEAHDFSREEIKAGLEDAMREQGMAGMAEAFLAEF